MRQTLTSAEVSTLKLALIGWASRCDNEAKQMEEWSREERFDAETRAKCVANAAASRKFEAEARALLAKI